MGVRGVVEDVTSQGREHEGRETGKRRMSQKMNIKYEDKSGASRGNNVLRAKERKIRTAGKWEKRGPVKDSGVRMKLRGKRARRLHSV